MQFPELETLMTYLTIILGGLGFLLITLWLSLVVWAFRDMRLRSRDPFAQFLGSLVVAALPGVGLVIYMLLRPVETLAEAYERALAEEALLQEIEERPACPGCSRKVDNRWIVCPHCHAHLKRVCASCGERIEMQWHLCPFCGVETGVAAEAVVAEEGVEVGVVEELDEREVVAERLAALGGGDEDKKEEGEAEWVVEE
ncbi:MAG TPA: zinc ribbon domain-containing protein [Anaerolineae bacterium]|nr:zinc ribbon domain-containing protein [Anaerolineae bacterium]